MNGLVYLLLAGFAAGVLAASMAVIAGFGWLATLGFYTLGGNIGLLLTGILYANVRDDDDVEDQVTGA